MKRTLIVALALILVPSFALAEDEPPACQKTPTKENALKMRALIESSMKAASGPLDAKTDLAPYKEVPATARIVVASTKCAYPLFSPKELTEAQAFVSRASKWADDSDARFEAEAIARSTVIVPLCEATWGLESTKADIARERANPGGVVDLRALHGLGERMQRYQDDIKSLTPQYVAHRHHAFTGWRSEGACVAAAARND